MPLAPDTKSWLRLVAIILTISCFAILIGRIAEIEKLVASSHWPSTPGEVVSVFAKPLTDDRKKTHYIGQASYRYAVDGKEYTAEVTRLGPSFHRSTPAAALADVEQYRAGMKAVVYYDPNEPGVGILEKGITNYHLVVFIAVGAIGISCGIVSAFTLRSWIRSARQNAKIPRTEVASREAADDLPVLVREAMMGDEIATFKPAAVNIFAGFVISLLIAAGGSAAIFFPIRAAYLENWNIPFRRDDGTCWLAIGAMSLLGFGLLFCAYLLAAYSRSLATHVVEFRANGLRIHSNQSIDDVLWNEISEIRETITYERYPILNWPAESLLPKVANTSYTIFTMAGKSHTFDANSVRSLKKFGKLLQQEAQRTGLPWQTAERHL
jgi:hypothetical protein